MTTTTPTDADKPRRRLLNGMVGLGLLAAVTTACSASVSDGAKHDPASSTSTPAGHTATASDPVRSSAPPTTPVDPTHSTPPATSSTTSDVRRVGTDAQIRQVVLHSAHPTLEGCELKVLDIRRSVPVAGAEFAAVLTTCASAAGNGAPQDVAIVEPYATTGQPGVIYYVADNKATYDRYELVPIKITSFTGNKLTVLFEGFGPHEQLPTHYFTQTSTIGTANAVAGPYVPAQAPH